MGRSNLTPSEIEAKEIISNNLNILLKKSGFKKVDIQKETNIPRSTISDYFGGKTLPSEENIDKLAKFFHVDKSEIDPRFDTEKEEQERTVDLEKDPVVLSYGGKPVSEEDMQIIKAILERHKDEGNN